MKYITGLFAHWLIRFENMFLYLMHWLNIGVWFKIKLRTYFFLYYLRICYFLSIQDYCPRDIPPPHDDAPLDLDQQLPQQQQIAGSFFDPIAIKL